MDQSNKSKRFYLKMFKALNGKKKTEALVRKFVSDEKLVQHILFFEKAFPEYELIIDEIIAQGDKVFIRVRFIGYHGGKVEDIPPTFKSVDVPFAVGYQIKNEKIVDFWAIGDQVELFEQLGIAREQAEILPK